MSMFEDRKVQPETRTSVTAPASTSAGASLPSTRPDWKTRLAAGLVEGFVQGAMIEGEKITVLHADGSSVIHDLTDDSLNRRFLGERTTEVRGRWNLFGLPYKSCTVMLAWREHPELPGSITIVKAGSVDIFDFALLKPAPSEGAARAPQDEHMAAAARLYEFERRIESSVDQRFPKSRGSFDSVELNYVENLVEVRGVRNRPLAERIVRHLREKGIGKSHRIIERKGPDGVVIQVAPRD